MTLKADIDAARAAIAKIDSIYHNALKLELAFIGKHPLLFVWLVMGAGVLFGVALVGAFVLMLSLGWGIWVLLLWLVFFALVAWAIMAGFRAKLATPS